MVELKIYLSEGLNEKFRRIAMAVYGYGRGSLSKAAEEAFANWCNEHDGASKKVNMSNSAETLGKHPAPAMSTVNPDERPHDSDKPASEKDNSYSHNSGQPVSSSGSLPNGEGQNISISWKTGTDNG